MSRFPNFRRIKIHRNYSVDEIARLFGLHKNTIRNWLKDGLQPIDQRRPTLILGSTLSRFLEARRQRRRQRCRPGEIYCVKCRKPVKPAANIADYLPLSPTSGNLRGMCPTCGILIHRHVTWARLDEIRGELEITIPRAQLHISDC
jgi:hypothetical protein